MTRSLPGANLQKLAGIAVVVQALFWVILLVVAIGILPNQGFSGLQDFNDPSKLGSARAAMAVIVWSDLFFGLAALISVYVLYRLMRARRPLIIAGAIAILLFGAVGWFVLHDIGFHIVNWQAIETDPASTNYAMDRLLWGIRNVVFSAVGLLTFLSVPVTNPGHPDMVRYTDRD